eukprot:356325-Pyramimonas_sp.AAC.1
MNFRGIVVSERWPSALAAVPLGRWHGVHHLIVAHGRSVAKTKALAVPGSGAAGAAVVAPRLVT